MVTVSELVRALMHQCNPQDKISTIHGHYDGWSEEYEESDPVLVVGRGEIFIVPDEYHAKCEAERLLGTVYIGTLQLPIAEDTPEDTNEDLDREVRKTC